MDNITAGIRVDVVSKQGSVLDVINLMNPNRDKSTASKAISALKQFDKELLNKIHKLRINGKGKPTPVADARTLVEIVWQLPGTAAREFRRSSANTVCRVLGGDMQLAREIEARHQISQSTTEGQTAAEFLVADTHAALPLISSSSSNSYEGLPIGFSMLPEHQQQSLALRMVESSLQDAQFQRTKSYYTDLQALGILDANLKMSMIDTLKNLSAGPVASAVPLIEAQLPLYQTVAAWLRTNYQSTAAYQKTSFTACFGKKMVAAYKKKYKCADSSEISTIDKQVNGEVRPVKQYDPVRDGDLFESVMADMVDA